MSVFLRGNQLGVTSAGLFNVLHRTSIKLDCKIDHLPFNTSEADPCKKSSSFPISATSDNQVSLTLPDDKPRVYPSYQSLEKVTENV